MKKNKKHKWKYQINIRKKVLVLVVLGVFLFVGLGFAILEANLSMHGTLEVSKYDKNLYNVFLKEYNEGYTRKYTGTHQDSMDSSKSTEDIYHFYAADNDNVKANEILEKNNVVFAERCWKMYRTTDTGGVRILYNGRPKTSIVNGKTQYECGSTKDKFEIGDIKSTLNLNGTYIYAKNYTTETSGNNTTFTLVDDPDDPDDYKSILVDNTDTAAKILDIVENYPYTCRNNTGTCSNYSFYKVDSQSNGTTANVYSSTYNEGFGYSGFASADNSPAYIGYMYGDTYTSTGFWPTENQNLNGSTTIIWNTSLSTDFWYADNVDWNTTVSGRYTLDNPSQVSSTSDYPNLVGKYTFRSSDQAYSSSSVYYIVAVDGNTMYYRQISNGENINKYNQLVFSDDITDNGDGTYSLDNPTSPITLNTWFNNYANYKNKYTCGDSSTVCQNPIYITNSSNRGYDYVRGSMMISKTRNGLVLENPIKIDFGKWYNGYNTTYKDYVYTCGNNDTTCTTANLRYIYVRNPNNYRYARYYNFGKSVIYENNQYKLQDVKEITPITDLTELSTHHYMCLTQGATECSSVGYVYSYTVSGGMYYYTLNNQNITSIQDILDAMFTKNTNNSVIKTVIDNWYKDIFENTEYEAKIDDTIYCNDRSYDTRNGYTFNESGFNDDGGFTNKSLYFKEFAITTDLSCTNITDRFSVSNNSAKLTYPIALPTTPEMNLLGNSTIRYSKEHYWLMSPAYPTTERRIQSGWVDTAMNYGIRESYPVRPVITLVKDTTYSTGNGSGTNPYVINMSN